MPELPEVETIRRGLDERLRGARVVEVVVRETRLRRRLDRRALGRLVGRRVERVGRRAKYLVAEIEGGLAWLMHLGMSGRIRLVSPEAPTEPHEHVRVRFEGPLALVYRDPRRFGLMRVGPASDFEELHGLGPEPLDDGFSESLLWARLRMGRGGATHRAVKAALLDQRLVAGIGNIYANEILFQAGVRPTRRCHRLTAADVARIVRATRAVLEDAVLRRGTSFSDYFDSDGIPGTFQEVLTVFDRAGAPCRRCGRAVRRRAQGGRSSFYCPRCQR